jgi:hypothetical protein
LKRFSGFGVIFSKQIASVGILSWVVGLHLEERLDVRWVA